MPDGFGYPDDAELWIPLEPQNAQMGRDSHNDETVARLAPGVSIAQAEAELQGIAERLKQVYPTHNAAVGAHVASLRDTLVGPVKSYLRLLLLAVVAVLLVACVNLASANLARGAGRARELAIRTVLGAGRGRLARQLLTENVLVALCGGAIGVVLAHWLVRVLLALNPHPMPRASTIGIDSGVLLFAVVLTLITGVMIGLLPALQVGRADLRAGMTAGGRGTAVGRSSVRRVLVATEVAFAVLLLVAAGLVVRSFRTLLSEKAGFDADGVLAVHIALPETRYPTGNAIAEYYNQALASLRSIPGVESAALINIPPLSRSGFGGGMSVDGGRADQVRYSDYRIVSPGYFETMHIPLLAGRAITTADDSTSEHVMLINQAMAKKFFPGENPIGKRLRELGMDLHRDAPITVVGVVGDVRSSDLAQTARPAALRSVPAAARARRIRRVCAQNESVAGIARRGRPVAASVDGRQRPDFRRDDDRHSHAVCRRPPVHHVRARRIRGARSFARGDRDLRRVGVLRRATDARDRRADGTGCSAPARRAAWCCGIRWRRCVAGSAVGIAAALVATRLMRSMLYGVSPTDPTTFAIVTAVLLGVALVASAVPAMRAARVDPIVALREE